MAAFCCRGYATTMRTLLRTMAVALVAVSAAACTTSPSHTTWNLKSTASIAGVVPEVVGSPKSTTLGGRSALCFDGRGDGLLLTANPVAGWAQFTVEIQFRPDGDGPEEQRFFHIQDDQERRLLIETRVNKDHTWALDTFLRDTDTAKLTLLDRAKTQPTDAWYWAALTYDGTTMRHYINGVQQLEGQVAFAPMGPGRTSLGVRLNQIHWFKGCIAQVRFTAAALATGALQTR
jgi:hypothetical protein